MSEHPRHRNRPAGLTLTLLLAAAAACSGADGEATADPPGAVAEWRLAGPIEEIGVAEGEAALELHDVTDALRLPDGRVVLLDAASAELRMYDSDGAFLLRAGGRGEGPGEFRRPARIRLVGGDVILVEDPVLRRSTRFDTALQFQSDEPWPESDDPFPREVWLYGRYFVDGPPAPAFRVSVRRALDVLPPPAVGEVRRVVVDEQWRLWVNDGTAGSRPARWHIHDMKGRAFATIELPAAFRATQLGQDFIVGVATDSLGVERVRVYGIEGAPESPPAGTWTAESEDSPPPAFQPSPPGTDERLAGALRRIQMAQELYYSRPNGDFRYADDVGQLELTPALPIDLEVHVLHAGPRGYTLVAFDPEAGVSCAVTIGVGGPIGWAPGRVLCT